MSIIEDEIQKELEIEYEDREEDVVTDVEATEFERLTDVDIITEKGIIRDEKGRFIKGTSPPGRPKKIRKLMELIERRTSDGNMLVDKLVNIAFYDPDMPIAKKDEKTGKVTFVKRRYHFVNATVQLQALKLLFEYYFGPPARQVNVDQNVNINIEKKVADITQLINQNKERLKLVK